MHGVQTEGSGIKSSVPLLARCHERLPLPSNVMADLSLFTEGLSLRCVFSPLAFTHEPLWQAAGM